MWVICERSNPIIRKARVRVDLWEKMGFTAVDGPDPEAEIDGGPTSFLVSGNEHPRSVLFSTPHWAILRGCHLVSFL